MNFDKFINNTSKIYSLLQKVNLEDKFNIDYLFDKYFPQIQSKLLSYSKISKIALCSTNGKKTTLNILNQIFEKNNNSFITNIDSNSKKYPVFLSIINSLLNPSFNIEEDKKDYYTFIFDEFELLNYFNSIKFDYLLLNNIFCDQKEFAQLSDKRKIIQNALLLDSKVNLVINADEPLFFEIDNIKDDLTFKKRNKIYFGFNSIEYQGKNLIEQKNDLIKCPLCSSKLEYKKRFYSHLGQYECACGFKRPKTDISANAKIYSNYTFLDVFYKDNKFVFKLPLTGMYNAYNALGAISLALSTGIERKIISSAFDNFTPLKGRDEIIQYKDKEIKIKTIKNPTSLTEALGEIYLQKNVKIIFCLNDNIKKDGKDTSWIWDSNFSALSSFENKIYVSSKRFDDMALRLKYAGVNPGLIIMDSDIKNAIECCYYDLEKNENMLILASPSLIDEIYKILKK